MKYGYLDYRHYKFGGKHDLDFAVQDARIIGISGMAVAAVMFAVYTACVATGAYALYSGRAIACFLFGCVGLVLAFAAGLSANNKSGAGLGAALRITFSLAWLSFSFCCFALDFDMIAGTFAFSAYSILTASLMHVGPLEYAACDIAYIISSLALWFSGHDIEISFIAAHAGLAVLASFLVFYNNGSIRRKFESIDVLSKNEKRLRDELDARQSELLDGARSQVAMQENIIIAIADLVENRDFDTGTHIKATSYYAKLIADGCIEKGVYPDLIDEDFSDLISKAAPMHDLGKIAVPDAILKAPRRLTDSEFNIMKRHTVEGSDLVEHIYRDIETPEYITCASNIARYHHERWDGKGYPEGLSGESIPIEARVMAVADVFDALVSKRCYKDSYPLSEAFDEIRKNAGTQFDPVLADVFLSYADVIESAIVDEFRDIDSFDGP